jgi:hypothetical protein
MPLFAFPGSEQVAAFAVKCLAVAGGLLAGYVLGALLAWALDRWAFAQKSPEVLKKSVRVLVAIAVALLVAFVVFGDGSGGGLFGGGGGTSGTGAGTPNVEEGKKAEESKTPPPETKGTKADIPKGSESQYEIVRVTFLGGDAVRDDRFYKLDESEPLTFDQLKAAIKKRKEAATKPLMLYKEFLDDPRLKISRDSINVRQVESWAEGQGIKVP